MTSVLVYNNLVWRATHLRANETHLGFIPTFLSLDDPRPAAAQFDANYAHGGGWTPFGEGKWQMLEDRLEFPGDPPFWKLYETRLRGETITIHDHAIVAITQPDGSFAVARLD